MAIAVTIGLVVALTIWWIFEYRIHQRSLKRIPIRVHINGSRGKSSITRLIGGALREGGIRTVTKTTGTNARFIFPDGTEEPIIRIGPANIKEQRWVIRRAAALDIQALVTECMAIDPELQWVLEHKYIKGTIGVLTNVRSDHLDVMGPSIHDATDAMSSIMSPDGICYTAESELFEQLNEIAETIGCELILTDPDSITDEEIHKFSYIEHKENVALSLAVAQHVGVPRDTALQGMYNAAPDPGVLEIFTVEHENKRIRFANAFAANDPESTLKVWELLKSWIEPDEQVIVLANSRADRIHRASQLGGFMGEKLPADFYILVGALLNAISDRMIEKGIPAEKIEQTPDGNPQKIFDFLINMEGDRKFLVGIGNIGGAGHAIADFFEEMSNSSQ